MTAGAFAAVGDLTGGLPGAPYGGHAALDFMSPAHGFNMAGHAAVGCLSAMASRGKCGPGALSGMAGSFAGPLLTGLGKVDGLIAHSLVGGLASVAGGGKFGNGAMTAAFGYLFNEMYTSDKDRQKYYEEPAAPNAPPGVDIDANMTEAATHGSPRWFYEQVKSGGPWDFKHFWGSGYEDFRNHHYGAVGKAFGGSWWPLFTDFEL